MARFQPKAGPPPAEARADRDAQDVITGVTDKGGEAGQPVPLQPSPRAGWFARTCERLKIASPDQIVAFSHSPSSVSVKLADGSEYCLMKASF